MRHKIHLFPLAVVLTAWLWVAIVYAAWLATKVIW
jgi:hypothetical protein